MSFAGSDYKILKPAWLSEYLRRDDGEMNEHKNGFLGLLLENREVPGLCGESS
jgi:hypothetical protein